MPTGTDVEATIKSFLTRVKRSTEGIDRTTSLFAEGLGLDSLETAELASVLEDEFDVEPFSEAPQMPQTVGDVLDFYAAAEA